MTFLDIKEAAESLQHCNIIAYPTETVYGIGGNPFCNKIFYKLKKIKKRENEQFILLLPDKKWVKTLTEDISEKAFRLMENFWPGPLTIIFKKKSSLIELPGKTVALRISPHKTLTELFQHYYNPLISTSANISGKPPAVSYSQIKNYFNNNINILKGESYNKKPSTIYDSINDRIIRHGDISENEIKKT